MTGVSFLEGKSLIKRVEGAKVYKGAEDAIKRVYKEKETYMPQEDLGKVYDKHYRLYRRLYSALKGFFNKIEAAGKPS